MFSILFVEFDESTDKYIHHSHFILFDPVYTGFYNYFSCYSSFMRNLKDERTKIWMLVKYEGLKFEKYKDVIYKTFFSLNFLDKKKKKMFVVITLPKQIHVILNIRYL